jgi:hypothetical protein
MAISHEQSIAIARPAATVFERLIDVERWPVWLIASGIVRVTRMDLPDGTDAADVTDPPADALAAGAQLVIEQRLAGVRTSIIEATVTELSSPTRFAVDGRDADGIAIRIEATIEATDVGCHLDWRLTITLPLRYRAFESMAAPQVRRAAALDLEAFRIRLESSPTSLLDQAP